MIVAGFGCRKAATVHSLMSALLATGYRDRVACLAAPDDKAQSIVFEEFATSLGLSIRSCSSVELRAQKTQTASQFSEKYRGTGSVAEAAALVVAGTGAGLIVLRCISEDGMATCAIARGDAL